MVILGESAESFAMPLAPLRNGINASSEMAAWVSIVGLSVSLLFERRYRIICVSAHLPTIVPLLSPSLCSCVALDDLSTILHRLQDPTVVRSKLPFIHDA